MRKELFKARKAAGLTQEQLALAVGIDRTAYNRIERGARKPPVDVALKIAAVLGKRVEDLFLLDNVHEIHNKKQTAPKAVTLDPTGTG